MTVEAEVVLLNADLEMHHCGSHAQLLRAFADQVHVICDNPGALLSVEVAEVGESTLHDKIERFIKIVAALPPEARAAWDSASRRALDIGIQSALRPHSSHWTVPAKQLAALAALNIDIAITVYGADYADA
jgi:hypothetical protein